MTTPFILDDRLAADSLLVGDLPLCQVRLMDDAQYPWLVLVPRRMGVREICELTPADRATLMDESCRVAEALIALLSPKKLNIAALGNVVPQLHVHHVARFEGDPAWPAPVWGKLPPRPYQADECELMLAKLWTAIGFEKPA